MATATGSVTGHVGALRALRAYARGDSLGSGDLTGFTGTAVGVSDQWTEETNGGGQPTIPGSGNATDGEVYLTGPGGGSDEIYVGIQTYRNAGTNAYNWDIRGATDFSDAAAWGSQTNISPSTYFALAPSDSQVMTAYFFVNGRRIIAAFVVGSSATCCYMGFINQFSTTAQFPYPLGS